MMVAIEDRDLQVNRNLVVLQDPLLHGVELSPEPED
eukprot:CAMPEP_0115318506 /NCGR_PEP_ID=MMETSP0270-20121206/79243_1 /TAXON_ID=71861 /ORGANISM="Scrippsiella trochoidea, Strain CCMP3099" /LENGTH=35 /DNA_ID= /DNA_START= /DNA_END= /DNA_ORIENTATION=